MINCQFNIFCIDELNHFAYVLLAKTNVRLSTCYVCIISILI